MINRIAFACVALFWVVMNVLLWRFEYGAHNSTGSPVPAEVVWEKVLTAPDSSSLNIFERGRRIGFCRWSTSVSEAFARLDQAPTSSEIAKVRKGRVRFDGSVRIPDVRGRLHFTCNLQLDKDKGWEELDLRLRMHRLTVSLDSRAAEKTVWVRAAGPEDEFEHVFTFAELQNPQRLLGVMASYYGIETARDYGLPQLGETTREMAGSARWDACLDTLQIGHEPVQVYRLHTRLMNRFDILMYISRVGEIFRVDLPNGIVLVHDKLTGV